jgi:hypothetical protein
MEVSPKVTFYIGLVSTVAMVCATSAIWAGWIPEPAVAIIVGANNAVAKIGLAVMTFLSGVSGSQHGPIAKLLRGEPQ